MAAEGHCGPEGPGSTRVSDEVLLQLRRLGDCSVRLISRFLDKYLTAAGAALQKCTAHHHAVGLPVCMHLHVCSTCAYSTCLCLLYLQLLMDSYRGQWPPGHLSEWDGALGQCLVLLRCAKQGLVQDGVLEDMAVLAARALLRFCEHTQVRNPVVAQQAVTSYGADCTVPQA